MIKENLRFILAEIFNPCASQGKLGNTCEYKLSKSTAVEHLEYLGRRGLQMLGEPSDILGLFVSNVSLQGRVASYPLGSVKTVRGFSGAHRIWPLAAKRQLAVSGLSGVKLVSQWCGSQQHVEPSAGWQQLLEVWWDTAD